MLLKKRHNTCHVQQQARNDTRQRTSKKVEEGGKGKELIGVGGGR